MKITMKKRTPLKQRLSYSVGHIFNDLCSAVWFTYFIVYFNRVVGLSTTNTGLLFLIAQGSDALLTPFMGLGCDRVVFKVFARYGKRKIWHLFGTLFVTATWPFLFSPCLVCSPDSPEWVPLVYFSVVVIIFHVGWASVQIAHLSLIPEIAKSSGEIVEFNAIRLGLCLHCSYARLVYSPTHSLTLIHSLILSLTHSLTHSRTHSLAHSLTGSVLTFVPFLEI